MSIRLSLVGVLLAGCLISSPQVSAQEAKSVEPIGYFLGISIGQNMAQSGFKVGDFDMDAMLAGFSDALAGKEPTMSEEQLQATQKKIQQLLEKRFQATVTEKQAENSKWLAANAKKNGVKALEGGLQYQVLKAGTGKSPTKADRVRVHYTGKLVSGKVFDSSVQRGQPAEFGVGQVIPGWTMALQKMKVGDKWMLYIPSDLAYGERGSPPAIGPNEVLVFEVELLGIL